MSSSPKRVLTRHGVIIERDLKLVLERDGDTARLEADFADAGWFRGRRNGYVVLDIRVPHGIALAIDDGAGSIDVRGTRGDVRIDDGSGSIEVEDAASVRIDDGSGSIELTTVTGNVTVIDGSGSVRVRDVRGSVTVDDGSGSIRVSDVDGDFTVIDDGSGGVPLGECRGRGRRGVLTRRKC